MDAMSCLPPPAASFISPAYYTDAAIARALHYSMSSDNHSHQYSYSPAATSSSSSPTSSSLLADLPFCSAGGGGSNWFADFAPAAAPPTGLTCDSVLVSSDAPPRAPPATATNKRRLGLGTASAGRAGKRRPRASKRAPTTYISTDPANFRIMVQHVTGVQAADDGDLQTMPASFDASSAGMLDCPPPAFDSTAFGEPTNDDAAAAALHHRLQLQQQQQQQQQPCFPTLDSWSVMYENSELL